MSINCTLHHFVHPTWFEDNGGFEKEENIADFVAFASFAAREWGRRIKMWATFNEPTCLVFGQYFIGVQPPAHFLNFSRMGTVCVSSAIFVTDVYKHERRAQARLLRVLKLWEKLSAQAAVHMCVSRSESMS